jgi:hypothetical protein
MIDESGNPSTTSASPPPGQRPDEAPLWQPDRQPAPGGDPTRTRPEIPDPAVREVPGFPSPDGPPDGPDKERA